MTFNSCHSMGLWWVILCINHVVALSILDETSIRSHYCLFYVLSLFNHLPLIWNSFPIQVDCVERISPVSCNNDVVYTRANYSYSLVSEGHEQTLSEPKLFSSNKGTSELKTVIDKGKILRWWWASEKRCVQC